MGSTRHIIINGDSRTMSELKDKSVRLVVTSPPYWQLKDYGAENQQPKDKTFVNAHLLKERLAEVNNDLDFKYKSKFQAL